MKKLFLPLLALLALTLTGCENNSNKPTIVSEYDGISYILKRETFHQS